MRKLLLLPLIFLACSEDEAKKASVDRDLVPSELYSRHIEEFYQAAADNGVTVQQITPIVAFADVPDCSVDAQTGFSKSYKEGEDYVIEIDNTFKVFENDLNFGVMIYREMAHLLLDKPYASAPSNEFCDYLIMYPCANTSMFEGERTQALECLF